MVAVPDGWREREIKIVKGRKAAERWSEGRGDERWSLVWTGRCRRRILLVRERRLLSGSPEHKLLQGRKLNAIEHEAR